VPDAALDFVVRKLGHVGVFGILVLLPWWPDATGALIALAAVRAHPVSAIANPD
jgi:hypothetical protein